MTATIHIRIIMIATIMSYIIIASIGCSPLSVATCEIFNTVGIDTQIALTDVDGKISYNHVYVIINGNPCEPRYFGLYLQDNIDYNNPYAIYNTTNEYTTAGYTILPDTITAINAIGELI